MKMLLIREVHRFLPRRSLLSYCHMVSRRGSKF